MSPDECESCGIDERVHEDGLCAWCRADLVGRPFGACPECDGARADDGSCACKTAAGRERGR